MMKRAEIGKWLMKRPTTQNVNGKYGRAGAKKDGGNELWKVEQERRQGVVAGGIALWQRDGWGGVDK